MTKYNEEAIEAACEALDWTEGLVVTDAIVLVVFDTLERAPWWEQVEIGYEFTHGEPHRVESPTGVSSERATTHNFTISEAHQSTYFRDTRWTPPPAPLAVGDVIETKEQAESLPVGTIAVTESNEAFRKVGVGAWKRVGQVTAAFSDRFMAGDDDRIIYLPRGDSE